MSRRILIAFIVLATLTYYAWTGTTAPGGLPPIHGQESDHFNRLSRGFRSGHLYLDAEVPEALLNAPNPYDPIVRQKTEVLHDASYFRGKYYIYFGPAPVVTLLLPFSWATGRDLPLPYGVWFFSSLGYLALVGIFRFVQRRYFPDASLWTLVSGLIALGGANMLVALLRRSHIWELSGASGFGFFAVSLLCLIRALHSPRAIAWASAGGLALGLAVGSRPSYIVCSLIFVLPLFFRRAKNHYDWRAVFGAAAGCSVFVLALLVYNQARFGDALEFGLRYQLTSVIESESRHFSLAYVPFHFRVYFLSALRWLPTFPFANGIVVPPFPPGLGGYEFTLGLFPNLPFSLLSLIAIAGMLGWRSRRDPADGLWLSVGVVAAATALNTAFLLCFFGSCIRYMVDFTPGFMLLAAIGLFLVEARLDGGFARNLWRGVGLVLALFSAFASAAAVVNFYDPTPGMPPQAYRPVARAFNRPAFWWQSRRAPDYGPREIALSFPSDRTWKQESLVEVTRNRRPAAEVFVEYVGDAMVRFGYREANPLKPTVFSPAVPAPPGARHVLHLSIGGPYSDFDGFKGRLRAHFDHVAFWDVPVVSLDAYPGRLHIGDGAAPNARHRFTGEIHAVRALPLPEISRQRFGGIRVRIALKPEMVGRAFPLLTTGRTKAGDLFFMTVQADKISFGYDHWGHHSIASPDVPVRPGGNHVVEFWLPALAPPDSEPKLVVKFDGVIVWERTAPAFPATPETVYLGGNPIGGSSCETALENGVFEELRLPFPPR